MVKYFAPPPPPPHIASLVSISHQNQLSFVFQFSFHSTVYFESRYIIYVNVRGIVAPSPAIYGVTYGHVDLQEYANGSIVSNNNIYTILFFNTYYHKQINKISIAAFNETFR